MIGKKSLIGCLVLILLIMFSSCSTSTENESADSGSQESRDQATIGEMNVESEIGYTMEEGLANNTMEDTSETSVEEIEEPSALDDAEATERKIIYQAYLHAETANFDEQLAFIEKETKRYQGYIVQSASSGVTEDHNRNGTIIARIPADQFQRFLSIFEDGDMELVERSVSGDDVTEQYVDLSSRLDAKKVAEERLLQFMKEAEKTEDLLKISADLTKIQEEIEQLTGKIRYLENQSDFATVEIYLSETKVAVSSVPDQSESTWQKTKEQFIKSINLLLNGVSALFIFIVGNLPIFLVIGCIILISWLLYKKISKKRL
ncbi:hypothetical protein GGQ92_001929 [Gracilibacillus halotolerans]|uniref:DUF4349 domain-containing protein n=1 Tax=Gracilibacillus halotolerans TaxID=74386 RepID=A0A841RKX2_9BACI|nr:DUF4349 domain-containing protein [Gracilibacillus halotolerans]MBB6513139.1 hypothetical protein [Gracilibacillus halotolerans]